jgi:hypothetical protein
MSELAQLAANAYGRGKRLDDVVGILAESGRAMMVVDGDNGEIVAVNDSAGELFGQPLIGASLNRLVPERYQRAHDEQRSDFMRHLVARPMSAAVDVRANTKAHGETRVRIGLTPIPETRLVIAEIDPLGDSVSN